MSDLLGFKVHDAALEADLRAFQRTMKRATQQALREVGRQVKREARKIAPVYQGDRPDVVKGAFKRSISSSKRITQPAPGVYQITVGPRGRVNLYAKKLEDNVRPTMHDAYDKVKPEMAAAYERVFARVVNRA